MVDKYTNRRLRIEPFGEHIAMLGNDTKGTLLTVEEVECDVTDPNSQG